LAVEEPDARMTNEPEAERFEAAVGADPALLMS
jgi:hypothetical protein